MTIWWRGWWHARSACRPSRTRAAWSITWRFTEERPPAGCVERCSPGWQTWGDTSPRFTEWTCNFNLCHLLQPQMIPSPSSSLKLFLNTACRKKRNKQKWHTCDSMIVMVTCSNLEVIPFWFHSGYWDYSSEEPSSFDCSVCGKRFKYRTSLSHHMKCHTGEATCPHCGKVLSSKANLNRHMPTCTRAIAQWAWMIRLHALDE